MTSVVDYPLIVFVFSFILFGLSAFAGDFCRRRLTALTQENREDFSVIQGASLTLLGLLIGFTFSMTITRYDQRKNYEEAEANAIGTEYVRAGLLPATDAAKVHEFLKDYLDQRVLFYVTRDWSQLRQIDSTTAQLQAILWSTVQTRAVAQPTPVNALAAAGMNDVLNSQGYTQAAWWNRIPFEVWVLLAAIGMGCNVLIGYGAHRTSTFLFLILPLAVSVSFFLIADIDSPRGGVIRVRPQNLLSLSQSLRTP
jgi:hypothetical protein